MRTLYESDDYAFYSFGGYGEVGRNCFGLFDPKTSEMLLIDCGLIIPRAEKIPELPPDHRCLPRLHEVREFAQKGALRLTCTHGHGDHAWAYPALFKLLNSPIPIVCSYMSSVIIAKQFQNAEMDGPEFALLGGDAPLFRHRLNLGAFDCEHFAISHSIPQTRSVIVRLNGAKILFVSDFKRNDCFALPGLTDAVESFLAKEAPFDLVVYDGLYCDRGGVSPSEDTIRKPLQEALAKAPGHLVATFYASNISRYQLVAQECAIASPPIALGPAGRTMENMVEIGKENGWIVLPKTDERTGRFMVAATGHQAEGIHSEDPSEMAALVKTVKGAEGGVEILPNTSFLFLSDPIPGNEGNVKALVYALLDRCPDGLVFLTPETRRKLDLEANEQVIGIPGLHASGHGFRGDHEWLLELTKPKIAIPYHMPKIKAKDAIYIGINPDDLNSPD